MEILSTFWNIYQMLCVIIVTFGLFLFGMIMFSIPYNSGKPCEHGKLEDDEPLICGQFGGPCIHTSDWMGTCDNCPRLNDFIEKAKKRDEEGYD